MITIDNKVYRNLEESVQKLVEDVTDIKMGALTEANFGIRVKDVVDQKEDIPHYLDPENYIGEFGDAYLVGESAPFTMYIFTYEETGPSDRIWLDVGLFPTPGPTGATGAKGAAGKDGTNGVDGAEGSPGKTGPPGPKGTDGRDGATGPKGEKGDTGVTYKIIEKWPYDQTQLIEHPLPDPSFLKNMTFAYLVPEDLTIDIPVYDLYVQMGTNYDNAIWTNVGPIAQSGTQVSVNGQFQQTFNADIKMNKIIPSEGTHVPAVSSDGSEHSYKVTTSATSHSLIIRNSSGLGQVSGPPVEDNDISNKRYVDSIPKMRVGEYTFTQSESDEYPFTLIDILSPLDGHLNKYAKATLLISRGLQIQSYSTGWNASDIKYMEVIFTPTHCYIYMNPEEYNIDYNYYKKDKVNSVKFRGNQTGTVIYTIFETPDPQL